MPTPALLLTTSTVVAGVFTGTVSLGTAILAVMLLAVGGYFATRYKIAELATKQTEAANEAANTWRENYTAERTRADDFERRYQEQRALKHEALTLLSAEKLKTDQTIVLQALSDTQHALSVFHEEFVAREEEAAAIRASVVQTEARIVSELGKIARALEHLPTPPG